MITVKATIQIYLPVLFFSTLILCLSCAPNIPTAEYPAEMERTFPHALDEVWNSVQEVIKTSNGTTINTNESAGIIVFYLMDKESKAKVYINVYMKTSTNPNITEVYLTTRLRSGGYMEPVDREFFKNLAETLTNR